jgi:N-acetylmuramoyl-L-alanine amidase
MVRLLLSLFVTTALLWAGNYASELSKASKLAESHNKSDQFTAYNTYKYLYLQATIDHDNALKLEALKGIVTSGNTLHIDVVQYEKEYYTQVKNSPRTTAPQVAKPIAKPTVNELLHIKDIAWENGNLELAFSEPLKTQQINYFTLHNTERSRYRYVFDISNTMQYKQHNLQHNSIQQIKLAQYKPDTLRLVFDHNKPLKMRYSIERGVLIIDPGVEAISKGPQVASTPKTVPTSNKIIVIDPGHGGKDPGAVGYKKYREKVVVMQIASELSRLLKKAGFRVYMTRTNDRFIKLRDRTNYANKKQADLFISLHANAVAEKNANKANGIETYFLSNNTSSGSERAKRVAKMENSKDLQDVNFYGQQDFINILNREKIIKSERLAHDLQRNMLAILSKHHDVKDAGVREGPFWILVGAQMPAVLVEVGFITHPTEAQRLVNKQYQQWLAEGLANGIEQYFLKNP